NLPSLKSPVRRLSFRTLSSNSSSKPVLSHPETNQLPLPQRISLRKTSRKTTSMLSLAAPTRRTPLQPPSHSPTPHTTLRTTSHNGNYSSVMLSKKRSSSHQPPSPPSTASLTLASLPSSFSSRPHHSQANTLS